MQKNKAQFCVEGDKQIAGVDYFKSHAPVASWSTVHMVMNLVIQVGWATVQVNFSNTFVHTTLKEEVYVELPEMLCAKQNLGKKDGVVLKLKNLRTGWFRCRSPGTTILKRGLTSLT
jgi:hypothetical protein